MLISIPRSSFFVIAVLYLASCRPEVQRFSFQNGTKAYFTAAQGERWVYRELGSNVRDTLVSTEIIDGFAQRSNNESEISSVTILGRLVPKLIIRAEAIETVNADRIAILSLFNNTFAQGPVLINFGDNFEAEDNSEVLMKKDILLEGVNYPEVLDVTLKDHPQFNNLWIARDVGIIRMAFKNGDTLVLVEHTP